VDIARKRIALSMKQGKPQDKPAQKKDKPKQPQPKQPDQKPTDRLIDRLQLGDIKLS
jgi:transcriptional accessory protein Tex/SPT6